MQKVNTNYSSSVDSRHKTYKIPYSSFVDSHHKTYKIQVRVRFGDSTVIISPGAESQIRLLRGFRNTPLVE